MKKFIGAAAVCLLCTGIVPVHAESAEINSISIDCNVLKSGDAEITEKWDMDVNEGTEVYKSLYNMHEKSVTLESVTDEDGKNYTNIGAWNTSSSRSGKMYKCGINEADEGQEICMGIDSYGHKTYTMKYRVSRFINQYKDTQGIDYTFFSDMSIPVSEATIKVRNKNFTKNTKVWSFGYNGDVYPHNGYIEMSSSESPERMQLLAKTGGSFTNTDSTDSSMTFSEIKKDAFKGSSYKKENGKLFAGIFKLVWCILFFGPLLLKFLEPLLKRWEREKHGIMSEKRSVSYSDVHPFRNIPDASPDEYEFAAVYSDMPSNTKSTISGYLMSWYNQGVIEFTSNRSGRVNGITFLKKPENMGKGEADIYMMFQEAGGNITTDEFRQYCRKYSRKVSSAIKDAERDARYSVKAKFMDKAFVKIPVYSDNYFEKAQQIYGLYKFLNDEGNMKDKQYIEVSLWKKYLVAASFFGIAKKVEKQMRQLVPDVSEDLTATVNAMYCVDALGSAGMNAMAEARRSSGGGGHASFGGGGSHSSGGGGGGVR